MATATPPDAFRGADEQLPPGTPERRGGLTPTSLFVVLLICFVLVKIQFVVILVLVSLVLATTLERPVQLLERRLMLPRALAILLLYVTFFGILILAGILAAPGVRDQFQIFQAEAPQRLNELRASWQGSSNGLLNSTGQDLLGRAIAALDNPPTPRQDAAFSVLSSAVAGVVGIFATLVMTFYYLMERSFIRRVALNEMSPRMRQRVSRIWDDAEAKVGGWLRGQLTLCLVIGTMSMIGYGLIGVPFWPVLGIWAAITEIIPVLGPWLGGIPAVVLALTHSYEMALVTVLFAVFLQTTENWVLVPRIMRGAVGLSPLTVFIAITAGAQFYGVIGTLLAIPIAAFVQVIVTQFLDERRDANQPVQPRAAIPAWRWMRGSGRHGAPEGPLPNPVMAESPAAGNGSGGRREARRPEQVTVRISEDTPAPTAEARRSAGTTSAGRAAAPPESRPSAGRRQGPLTHESGIGRRWSPERLRRPATGEAEPTEIATPAEAAPPDDAPDDGPERIRPAIGPGTTPGDGSR